MKMAKWNYLFLSFAYLFLGCGDDGDASTDTPGVEISGGVLDAIPDVTGFVRASPNLRLNATTGIPLGEWDEAEWDAGKSQELCFTGDVTKVVLNEAAGPDIALCKIGVLESAGLIELTTDFSRHDFQITNLFGGSEVSYHSVYAEEADSRLTRFRMYSCNADEDQTGYLSADLSWSDATAFASVRSVSAYFEGGNESGQLATTSGTVNTSGLWTDKLVAFQSITNTDTLERNSSLSITQTSQSSLEVYGSFYGTNDGTDEASCFWAASEVFPDASPAATAIGDGAVKHVTSLNSQTCDGSEATVAWEGATRTNLGDPSTSAFNTQISSYTVPTLATFGAANVAFSGDDTWDCALDAGVVEVDLSNADTAVITALNACDAKYAFGRDSASCQTITD